MANYQPQGDENRVYVSPTLMLREIACRHCGQLKLSPRFVVAHNALREEFGIPIVWHSGYRCPEHQKEVYDEINRRRALRGLSPTPIPWNSYHLRGEAGDTASIVVPEETAAKDACLERLARCGFNGIGIQHERKDEETGKVLKVGFVHLDVRLGKFTIWHYGAGREDG